MVHSETSSKHPQTGVYHQIIKLQWAEDIREIINKSKSSIEALIGITKYADKQEQEMTKRWENRRAENSRELVKIVREAEDGSTVEYREPTEEEDPLFNYLNR